MLYLVIGGSKAGKSRYAEQLALKLRKDRLLYLATMIPVGDGEAGTACINRHRAQRQGLGFETIEQPVNLREVRRTADDVILLEDVGNLVGNYIFTEKKEDGCYEAVLDIEALTGSCKSLIAVAYSTVREEAVYDSETLHYIEQLNRTTRLLCEKADAVIQLQQGEPTVIKGTVPG